MDISVVHHDEMTDALCHEIAGFVAPRNSQPTQHIGYLGVGAAALAAELRDDINGEFAFALARDGDRLVGVLGIEWDPGIRLAWLLGPWGDDPHLLDRLYATLLPLLPAAITEQEMYSDKANARIIDFAGRQGFTRQSQNVILRFDRAQLPNLPVVQLPALPPTHRDAFSALHDRAFPNTHAPSAALLARNDPIRVVVDGHTLLGYVVLRLRPEQNDAQVEYIAVDEAARSRGVGAQLLTCALHEAFADPRFSYMDLVTGNPVARRLYEKVGFRLLHEMRSFRKGHVTDVNDEPDVSRD